MAKKKPINGKAHAGVNGQPIHSDKADEGTSKKPAEGVLVRGAAERDMFIDIYRNKMGNITAACKAFGMHRSTFYDWLNAYPDFVRKIAAANEEEKDWWEAQLKLAARGVPRLNAQTGELEGWKIKPDIAAIIWGTKVKCRDRGYTDRLEHVVPNKGEPMIDLERLTEAERETWYRLLEKATVRDADGASEIMALEQGDGAGKT